MAKLAIPGSRNACCEGCNPAPMGEADSALVIACSLGSGDFRQRVADIDDLSRRFLRASRREPLRLHLTYEPDALNQVQDLVAKESECCPFLRFDLRHAAGMIELMITAPASAVCAVDELFAHFAPHLAKQPVE